MQTNMFTFGFGFYCFLIIQGEIAVGMWNWF